MIVPRLLAFSLALGGLRDPRAFAVAAAATWVVVWRERPALGPSAAWLPWLGWAAISTLTSAQPLAGLPVVARWAAVLACASLAASWKPLEREEWLKSLLVVASGLACAALLSGAGRGFRSGMTGLIPPYYNYTAFVLAGAACAAGAWILHPRGARKAERIGAAAFLSLALLCLFLARSRGAWLGLGAGAAVWAIRRWGTRAAAAAAAAAAILGGLLAAGLLPSSIDDAVFKKYRPHMEARPRLWRAAASVATDHPWLGVGPGSFGVGFRRHPVPYEDGAARWTMSTDYAHSEPLQAAAETGWAGLALWLLGAGAAATALLARAGDDPVRESAAAAAAAMTAQLATDNMLQLPALGALWLSALALASSTGGARTWAWRRSAAAACAAFALVSWIPRAWASTSAARAAALFPAEAAPREDLAYAAAAAGNAAEAEAAWSAARKLEPYNAVHPWRLAQLAGAREDWAGAERLAAEAASLEPGFLNARLVRAEALIRLGRVSEARSELNGLRETSASRGAFPGNTRYEMTVWFLDEREFDRVSALAAPRR